MVRSLAALVSLCILCGSLGWADPVEPVGPAPGVTPPAVEPVPVPKPEGAAEPPAARPVPEPTTFPFAAVVTVNEVNVRGGPSTNHFPLLRLTQGAEVEVLRKTFEWYQVRPLKGVFCWVHRDLVKLDPDGKTGVVSGDRVNIRGDSIMGHEPVKGDVVDQVDRGTKVVVVGQQADFVRIEPTPDTRLFVRADMVTPKGFTGLEEGTAAAAGGAKLTDDASVAAALRAAEEAFNAEKLKAPEEWNFQKLGDLYRDVLARAVSGRMKEMATERLAELDRLAGLKGILDDVERARQNTETELAAVEKRRAAEEAVRAGAKVQTPTYTQTGLLQTLELGDDKPRFKLVDPDDTLKILCVVEGDPAVLKGLVGQRVGINGTFRISAQWSVKVLEVSTIVGLGTDGSTRIARPPARTN